MYAITWEPGTDEKHDQLFDLLREKRFADKTHHLWKNYSKQSFNDCVALSIAFDESSTPVFCASIAQRKCWPEKTYRIINRVWYTMPLRPTAFGLSPEGKSLLLSQINWLKANTNFELFFISRETNNWQKNITKYCRQFSGLDFNYDDYRYLTCAAEHQDSCWQRIVYHGNPNTLNQWKRIKADSL